MSEAARERVADPGTSALIVEVPDAEPAVDSLRRQHDANAHIGVPAHVTVLSPWVPPVSLTDTHLADLHDLIGSHAAFGMCLDDVAWFTGDDQPHVLYLRVAYPTPFRRLTRAVTAQWPEWPPYGGAHGPNPAPHLTIGVSDDRAPLEQAAIDVRPHLPIHTTVSQLALLLRQPGASDFTCVARFPLH